MVEQLDSADQVTDFIEEIFSKFDFLKHFLHEFEFSIGIKCNSGVVDPEDLNLRLSGLSNILQ